MSDGVGRGCEASVDEESKYSLPMAGKGGSTEPVGGLGNTPALTGACVRRKDLWEELLQQRVTAS